MGSQSGEPEGLRRCCLSRTGRGANEKAAQGCGHSGAAGSILHPGRSADFRHYQPGAEVEGSLVQAQQTLLTTISQIDPIYVIFSFTEAENLKFMQAVNEKRLKLP